MTSEGYASQTYNLAMARGWESKSIEAQQAEASEKSSEPRLKLSREEASRQREIEGLRLTRQRVLQELGASQHAQRRRVLEEALRELDKKLQSS
jgi:hypothetical protein